MSLAAVFVSHSTRRLDQSRSRIVACLDQLDDAQIWGRGGEHENAIGNLVLHLCGNLRQWIGYGVAGLDDIRERDAEFAARGGVTRAELLARLHRAVDDAVAVIGRLDADALMKPVRVQGDDVTAMEAVAHVVEHFGQHTGQIILLTKHATGEDLGFYRHLNPPRHGRSAP